MATLVGTPLHIFHVSCAAVVKRIVAARQQGLPDIGLEALHGAAHSRHEPGAGAVATAENDRKNQ